MTSNNKRLCVITGLIAVVIILLLDRAHAHQPKMQTASQVNTTAITQSILSTGSHWIMEATCKILKPNQ